VAVGEVEAAEQVADVGDDVVAGVDGQKRSARADLGGLGSVRTTSR
jgi:hypothetical protein